MNEILQAMKTRHAIRRFQNKQLDDATLNAILEAGLYAPSAGNNQYSRIVVCQDSEVNEKLGRINRWMQFKGKDPATVAHSISADQPSIQDDFTIMSGYYGAPTVLTVFTRGGQYASADGAMIASNIWLAAHALGVGACYVGRSGEVFATEYGMEMRKKWGVPDDMVPVCNILLGYREGPAPHDKPRKEGRILRV